ncbi:hypothetical protein BSKO_08215 [Bryopsis sp. KO-2023]|nr:hypothetical protein BSKO_08215 [Bryopsis sp. KO-2023]
MKKGQSTRFSGFGKCLHMTSIDSIKIELCLRRQDLQTQKRRKGCPLVHLFVWQHLALISLPFFLAFSAPHELFPVHPGPQNSQPLLLIL